jgi:hypothetical protein
LEREGDDPDDEQDVSGPEEGIRALGVDHGLRIERPRGSGVGSADAIS